MGRARLKTYKGFGWRFARPEEVKRGRVKNVVSEEELKRRMEGYSAGDWKRGHGPLLTDTPVVVMDGDLGVALRYYESVKVAAVRLGINKYKRITGACSTTNKHNKFHSAGAMHFRKRRGARRMRCRKRRPNAGWSCMPLMRILCMILRLCQAGRGTGLVLACGAAVLCVCGARRSSRTTREGLRRLRICM